VVTQVETASGEFSGIPLERRKLLLPVLKNKENICKSFLPKITLCSTTHLLRGYGSGVFTANFVP
jgi:hypothetical protein